jgi:hypothetical protein
MMQDIDQDWDAEIGLYGCECRHQGIHTRMPQGVRVHQLRENAGSALALIGSADPERQRRGRQVLKAVLERQDPDPTSPTFGIWGYYAEEPPSEMAPPDYNWADFIGLTLCRLLHRYPDRLDEAEAAAARGALARAGYAIFRRNVGPGYTNIAVKGAVVTACAGHLLGAPFLADYGTRRMQVWVEHSRSQGINEYNSPTYNLVALGACEAALEIVPAGAFKEAVAAAHRLLWSGLAEHYHQPTAQIAGPFSRCYSDLLGDTVRALIAQGAVADPPTLDFPCPEDLRQHFRAAVTTAVERRDTFQAARGTRPAVQGTTWVDGDACLGSVNRDSLWWQRRALIAYWNDDSGRPVVAKLRVLKDDRDWASTEALFLQRGPRALLGIGLLTDQGDHHPSLDRPSDGRFAARALRLRLELHAADGRVEDLGDGRYALLAGGHRLLVHGLPGALGTDAVAWASGSDHGLHWVEARIALDPERRLDPVAAAPLHLACGIEVLPSTAAVGRGPTWTRRDEQATLTWPEHDLILAYPATAQSYA